MLLHQVDPDRFIDQARKAPAHGRGAWTRAGIGFDYRYAMSMDVTQRIGTQAELSLDVWAVAAGCYAVQKRLIALGFLAPLADGERGIFGPKTMTAVAAFQRSAEMDDDGTVGRTDARALFTPLVIAAESAAMIPNRLLVGETAHESSLDPGAVGYFIYYGDSGTYRGVDRGMSQINSAANAQVTWLDAFDPAFAVGWSARRLRSYFEQFRKQYATQKTAVLWDAAVCAHNNPSAASTWAKTGEPPTPAALQYVTDVKNAIYL